MTKHSFALARALACAWPFIAFAARAAPPEPGGAVLIVELDDHLRGRFVPLERVVLVDGVEISRASVTPIEVNEPIKRTSSACPA